MGNGLIFAFVVALWAAYFVPLAVKRYDEAAKSTSFEKFSSLTRVVADPTESREVQTVAPVVTAHRPRITREAARVAARRRRNTLMVLTAGLVLTSALAFFGFVPRWSIVIPTTLIAAFLVAARLMVRSELGLNQGRETHESAVQIDEDENTVVLSHQFEDVDPNRKHVMERTPLEADALEERLEIAVPVNTQTGTPTWEPLPVTVPTYVTKPRVGRTIRTIEFGTAGAWTSGHIEGQDVEFPTAENESGEQSSRAVGE